MNSPAPQAKRKAVEYCYPTSTHAEAYGYGRAGCWIVALVCAEYWAEVVTAHATQAEAFDAAAKRGEEWHPLWVKYDQAEIDAAEARKQAQ